MNLKIHITRILFLLIALACMSYTAFSQGIINNGALIVSQSSSLIYIDGDANGNYVNQSNGTNHGEIDIDGKIEIEGNWTNNATSGTVFINTDTDGEVSFTGTTQQSIDGSASIIFEDVKINNTTGVQLAGSNNQTINGDLTFLQGKITTGSNMLIITNTLTSAITGANTDRYVVGNIRRFVTTNEYTFDVGTASNSQVAKLNITTLGSLKYLDVSFSTTSPGSVPNELTVLGTTITEFLDNGYWVVSPDNGTGVVYDITLTAKGQSNGGTVTKQHTVLKRSGGDWESIGTHSNATQSGTGSNPITAKRTALSGFSDFIIAKCPDDVELPIALASFTATPRNNDVVLNWQTATEINNDFFTIERSTDVQNWEEVATKNGAGNSNTVLNYKYIDKSIANRQSSIIYYRLKQTDFNGKFEYSKVISVKYINNFIGELNIYPNPVSNELVIEINENKSVLNFEIINSIGSVIYKGNLVNKIIVQASDFASGIYLIKFANGETFEFKKLIKE